MKNVLPQSMIVCLLFLAYSCSKSNDTNKEEEKGLVTQPDAIAANDGKSGGVYKGVIVGSTGTVTITLQGGTVSAEVTIDGITKVMTPQNLPAGWTSGQALTNVIFAGDSWQLTFSVTGNGNDPYISSISIPGHTGVAV
ncbi:hypothetical protein GFS24_18905 [Chitinophaga sp. SYP-B3965]|uniref:hypothetical protein n=1 Tax=Chitinophaga sp. SYP-B3965 TaxID=2663120 RepID=UPI0012998EAC|nr:hypothetical protein [Chitinophaga sp. SYP-B3965]MRG47199.1 hypothetical protein [Chitinophaga sp. SYP-B3965]